MRTAPFLLLARIFIGFSALSAWLGLPDAALAQTLDGTLTIPGEIEIRGRGWSQLGNGTEIIEFAQALVEAMILTAILAFHPRMNSRRNDMREWSVPRTMFLFSLIGLLLGFLVIHHGYLIGFVIFGLGGLFRFRMETSSLSDTAMLIVVSLVGLSVGLDLPLMATIATAGSWLVVWFFGFRSHLLLEVKFDDGASVGKSIETLETDFDAMGYRVVGVTKSKLKPVAEFILSSTHKSPRNHLVHKLSGMDLAARNIQDWHVE